MPKPQLNYKVFFRNGYALLRGAGIWLSDSSETKPKWFKAYSYWVISMLLSYNLSLTIKWITCTNLKEAAFAGYAETVTMMNPIKLYLLFKYKKDLADIISQFNEKYFQAKDEEEVELVNSKLEKYRRISRIYSTILWIWLIMVCIAPLFYETENGLVLPAYFPFSVSSSPGFQIAYVSQVISVSIAGCITMYTDIFMAANCTFLGLQCTLLSRRLAKIGFENAEYRKSFRQCLQHYKDILRFYKGTTKVFGKIYFWQLFSTTTSLSMILFVLSLAKPGSFEFFTLFAGALSVCCILLVPCTFASEMTAESELISIGAYSCNWADSNSSAFTKDVMFFIGRTQKPLLFKATWVFEISKTTYVSVLRMAMSYYTVLKNMNSPQE